MRGIVGVTVLAVVAVWGVPARATTISSDRAAAVSVTPAGQPYPCTPHSGESINGPFGDASAIGWAGNGEGVVACLGGSFYVQDGINTTYGYGIYNDSPTTWTNVDGYLPALETTFHRGGAEVSITNFGDELALPAGPYVAVYSRVSIHNPTRHPLTLDPQPSPGLVALDAAPLEVGPGATVDHDYVVAADRFGQPSPWPTADALRAAGGFDAHFAHMHAFWDGQLATIAHFTVPDRQLVDAYRAGFIYTQIARSGDHLNTGVNGYASEFSHDVIGILANLFTQGDFSDAPALLLEARSVVGTQGQYLDGLWTYSWPWAIYLLKTGDLAFVQANFATEGPNGPATPSIEDTAHRIAADRVGGTGIMGRTIDIDTLGDWTVDNYEALMGLAAYRYLAQRVGNTSEAAWATDEYTSLLAATNRTLETTIRRNHLRYLPCSMTEPNDLNRCATADDANWAAPFLSGRWAWDGALFGAPISGPGVDLIDATYDYGFARLKGKLPPNTFGGYPNDFYSSGYNAGYGSWGLASTAHRDQGILGYEFMIGHTQSGPLSWWESASAPNPSSPWIGHHPASGQGSSPHAWGMANANKVLLDSLAAQRADGAVIVGRGVPTSWTRDGQHVAVANFPTTNGATIGFDLSTKGLTVTWASTGQPTTGPV
ncbi:MAG TPA: sugar-binding protein, partial [Acidimicrobiia bacterium]|nr:sugar-binding protein [Acidimicrobiia bacterium]